MFIFDQDQIKKLHWVSHSDSNVNGAVTYFWRQARGKEKEQGRMKHAMYVFDDLIRSDEQHSCGCSRYRVTLSTTEPSMTKVRFGMKSE
ncbi:hypothetical protein PoB_001370200 [Plakobranchus ocellatus]|uniref:Protein FAR1-RELATED SEQUENCE n=1 Tax=Plakobranchus ocellatus TaxID=259542 RepID=A0AAV3YW45_9GAST|nr:hypothetical protein PoB_001370200 [Plakobranchus ocellatus]